MTARRGFLALTAAAAVLPLAGVTTTADAALLPLPDSHIAAKLAYNAYDGPMDTPDESRLWAAYRGTIEAALDTPATTLPGLAAKARMADYQLRNAWLDGHVSEPADAAEELLRSIMDDLLRLSGDRA